MRDTNTCIVTIRQLRISNLVFNELDKMNEIVRQQDSLIYAKQSRIDILTWQRDTFITSLENTQIKLDRDWETISFILSNSLKTK